MIRDLETLLLSVIDMGSRAYMHEAIRCYNAGAFRAAVVLSVAAGMDGLRKRLAEVAHSGGASTLLIDAHNQIDKKFTDQDAYESQLIDACENQASLITPSEAGKLRVTLKIRHLCAHPSGHNGSAEEARDAIATVIDLILSRPALTGMTGVTSIIERLSGPNFFPDPTDSASNKSTVETETRYLHPALYNALASRLVTRICNLAAEIKASTAPTNAQDARKNSSTFLAYFTIYNSEARHAAWKYLNRVIEDPATIYDALFILSHDPEGCHLAEPLVRERAIALVRRNLTNKYARRTARTLRELSLLDEDEVDEIIQAASKAFLDSDSVNSAAIDQALELGWPEIETSFFDKLIERCGSNVFAVANPAIRQMQSLKDDHAGRMSPAQQVRYVLTIADNAGRQHSATESDTISENGLGPRSNFLESLNSALQNRTEMLEESTNWEHVAHICEASSRSDILLALVNLFDPPTDSETAMKSIKMLRHLKSNSDAIIVQRATEVYERVSSLISEETDE